MRTIRRPRDPEQPLFSVPMIGWSVFQGGLAFGLLAATFLTATWYQLPEANVRELVFLSLIVSIVALILANRSFGTSLLHAFTRKNVMLRYVLGAVAAVIVLTVVVPAFRALLKFGSPDWTYGAVAFGIGGVLLVALELLKPLANRQSNADRAGRAVREDTP